MLKGTRTYQSPHRGAVPIQFNMAHRVKQLRSLVENHRWRVAIIEDGPGTKPPLQFEPGDDLSLKPRPKPSPTITPKVPGLKPQIGSLAKRRDTMSFNTTTTAPATPRLQVRAKPLFSPKPPSTTNTTSTTRNNTTVSSQSQISTTPNQSTNTNSSNTMDELDVLEMHKPSTILSKGRSENEVLAHFGMSNWLWQNGTSPSSGSHEIEAKFKFVHTDFKVTELVAANTPVSGGFTRAEKDFTVPEMPSEMLASSGMSTTSDNVFEHVDVDEQLDAAVSLSEVNLDDETVDGDEKATSSSSLSDKGSGDEARQWWERKVGRKRHYVEFTLDKRLTSHSDALAIIRRALGLKADQITVAGIKDFNGMTLQRVRVEGVSAERVRSLNTYFKTRDMRIIVSDFKYKQRSLMQGNDLYGNRFKIILRDVGCDEATFAAALNHVKTNGAPNYYGTQRFSWFAGSQDACLAGPMHKNWLLFAYRFLDFTTAKHTLRELLQRRQLYPKREQNIFRRRMVHYLRKFAIEPTVLSKYEFFKTAPTDLSDDPIGSAITNRQSSVIGYNGSKQGRMLTKPSFVLQAIREAYKDIPTQSRRLQCAGIVSYMWNQLLAARVHHFGSSVLEGDVVLVPDVADDTSSSTEAALKDGSTFEVHDNPNAIDEDNPPLSGTEKRLRYAVVTSENKHLFTPFDVVLPSFTFGGLPLPKNVVGSFYHSIASRYSLAWDNYVGSDILNGPRRAIIRPENVSYRYFKSSEEHAATARDEGWTHYNSPRGTAEGAVVEVCFDLKAGCYATVVLSELLRLSKCIGTDRTTRWPLPADQWAEGKQDPLWVETEQAVYDGAGSDENVEDERDHEEIMADNSPSLVVDDPFAKVSEWSEFNLKKNSERNFEQQAATTRHMFEQGLIDNMGEEEGAMYVGTHNIQAQPNRVCKAVRRQLRKRNRAGKALLPPRLRTGAAATKGDKLRPDFALLSHDTWNFL